MSKRSPTVIVNSRNPATVKEGRAKTPVKKGEPRLPIPKVGDVPAWLEALGRKVIKRFTTF